MLPEADLVTPRSRGFQKEAGTPVTQLVPSNLLVNLSGWMDSPFG